MFLTSSNIRHNKWPTLQARIDMLSTDKPLFNSREVLSFEIHVPFSYFLIPCIFPAPLFSVVFYLVFSAGSIVPSIKAVSRGCFGCLNTPRN